MWAKWVFIASLGAVASLMRDLIDGRRAEVEAVRADLAARARAAGSATR